MAHIPYEFLVRWNHQTGALQGAYVKTYDSVKRQEGEAQPVAIAGAAGFPMADILTAIQQGAITSMDEAKAATTVAKTAQTSAETALATEKAAHVATTQLLVAAQAKLAAQVPVLPL